MASPILCECAHVFDLVWQLFVTIKYPLKVDGDLCDALSCIFELESLPHWIIGMGINDSD